MPLRRAEWTGPMAGLAGQESEGCGRFARQDCGGRAKGTFSVDASSCEPRTRTAGRTVRERLIMESDWVLVSSPVRRAEVTKLLVFHAHECWRLRWIKGCGAVLSSRRVVTGDRGEIRAAPNMRGIRASRRTVVCANVRLVAWVVPTTVLDVARSARGRMDEPINTATSRSRSSLSSANWPVKHRPMTHIQCQTA